MDTKVVTPDDALASSDTVLVSTLYILHMESNKYDIPGPRYKYFTGVIKYGTPLLYIAYCHTTSRTYPIFSVLCCELRVASCTKSIF